MLWVIFTSTLIKLYSPACDLGYAGVFHLLVSGYPAS